MAVATMACENPDEHALSTVQSTVWLDQIFDPENVQYNIGLALQIDGDIDVDRLEKAVRNVASRHDALRLIFDVKTGVQRFLPSVDFTLPVLNFTDRPDAEDAARDHISRVFDKPFDLQARLLWDMQLIRVSRVRSYWVHRYHHLVVDGFSVSLIHGAMAAEYNRQSDVPEKILSYREYLAVDQAYKSSPRYERSRQFWRKRFAELSPPLFQYATRGARSRSMSRGQVIWRIDRRRYEQMQECAAREGLSITHFMLVLLSSYFSRVTGASEVVIGVAVHNRSTASDKRAVGMFSSIVPVGIRIDLQRSFVEAMREAALELRQCYRHQKYPIGAINRDLGLNRRGLRQLFDVTLSFEDFDFDQELGGKRCQVVATYRGIHAPLAVSLHDYHESNDLVVEFNYDKDVLDADRVESIQRSLALAASAAAADSKCVLGQLQLMDEREYRRVVEEFNATSREYPEGKLVHELFEAQVQEAPDVAAVLYEEQQLSYAELNRRANQLARYLRARGIGRDQLVGLCVERSLELVVGILGVLKAGGAYVPLDPSYPPERLDYLLKDASPQVVLTQARLKSVVAGSAAPIIGLDEHWEEIARQPSTNLGLKAEELSPHHLAYVMYTSGTTGEPKGVMIEHRSLVNYACDARRWFGLRNGDIVLQQNSLSFDLSVEEIFPAWLAGATLLLSDRSFGLAETAQLRVQPTVVHLTTAHWNMLVSEWYGSPERAHSQLRHVRLINVTGDVISTGKLEIWQTVRPSHTALINTYGPTETTVSCTVAPIAQSREIVDVTIGRPIANTQIYILDERHEPVPIGVVGEIYIGGAGVARGYFNQPQLTAERFIRDRFSENAQARLYKSGDLGRWRADGNIEYLGRNDHQVKLRGYRIELGEIEAQLARHAQVKEAVVLVREDAPGEKRLVAYVTSRDLAPSMEALRTHLKSVLPEYMMVTAFVLLEALPLTANGKLDRRALPAPGGNAYALKPYEAPQGKIEELLAGIWCELLRVERVGRHDNFFELGGHSLLAVQVLARIRQSLGRELALRELFEFVSVEALARQLSTAAQISQAPIERVARNQALALSLSQQRLWFIDQLEGAGAAYHIAGVVRLQGTLDAGALRASLDTLVSRHEVLRTVFASVGGEPVQIIAERAEFVLRGMDLGSLPKTEREARALELSQEEAAGRFDLSQGPLIRGALLRLSEQEHVLLVTMHHIVSDGWSMGILTRELSALYSAYREGRSNPLPALPIQYADYAQWQRQWLVGDVLQERLEYWRAHLQGAPSLLELPTDRPRPAVQSYQGDSVPVILGPELNQQLKQLSRRFDATLYMTLYAGFAILLSRLSGEKDIVIGTPVANRQRAEVEGLIGFFVNTLALRVGVEDELTVAELLQRTRALTLAGYAHQEAPFEQVVKALQPSRTLSHNPVFQIMLALHYAPDSELQLPGLKFASQDLSSGTAQFDLTLSLREIGSGIVGALSYASDLFDRSTIERWVEYFRQVLGQMARDVEQRIGALNLLPETEREQVIEVFNATHRSYPQEALMHELFEARVEKTPDAVAVIYEDEQLSYAELNGRTNQLARYLRAQGIGPDQLVGICLERSVELVVGILGVLKAGGAYVPLDPSYPAERLEYLLKDASPRAVLTQARLKSVLAGSALPIITLDEQWDEIEQQPIDNLDLRTEGPSAKHLAYVIYTSGSTGEPKGVMIEKCNASNLVHWALAEFSPQQLARTYFCTSINFDLSIFELFVPLAAGGTVYVARETMNLKSAGALTLINTVPSAMKSMMRGGEIPSSIQAINLAGEVLKQELVEQIFAKTSVQQISNLFGPTETTTYSSAVSFQRGEAFQAHIGRPISNTQIYILDEQRRPVPIGVVGEIYIGGAGVARGYLNRPQLTAERFIRNPFSSDATARMYKSGDRGRWRADGTIEYVGRNDHQVKLRGYRIELGEIESQLSRHAQVKEAVVLVREDVPGEKRLVAYVTSRNTEPSVEELRTHLKCVLPEYMMPAAFVLLESLPLTANGKLERKGLPAPADSAYALKAYEAPQGEIEGLLAGIWCELLRLERVGRQDNFFELGGHSLLIVQMIERLWRRGLGAEIHSVFESATLAELAAAVGERQWVEYAVPPNLIPAGCQQITAAMLPLIELDQAQIEWIVSTVPGGASNVQDIYPLTPLQEGILFHHLLNDRGGDTYVLPMLLALPSRAQLEKLIEALQAVIDRHDILRTAVLWEGLPRPVQVVYRKARLSVQELTFDPSSNVLEQMKARMAPKLQRLDLRTAPLMRLQVACAEGSPCYALLQMHHLMADYVAREILVEEVTAHVRDQSASLSPPVAFRGFVAQALGHALDADAGVFFRSKLGDVEESTAPFGLVDVHGDGSQIEEAHEGVEAHLADRVRRVARALSMSPAPLFHAAWGLVVARTSGRDDVVFGSVLSGRMQGTVGADRVLGMFINTLPLRLQMKGATVRAMVQQTQRELVDLLKYEQASLAYAQRCSGIAGSAPLFSAVLNYRHRSSGRKELKGEVHAEVEVQVLAAQERTNYPLTLSVDDLGEQFELVAQVDRCIDARRVLGYVRTALEALVAALESAPERAFLGLPMLPAAERRQVIEAFNATRRSYPQDATIHELFEAQVERTPDAVAVIYEDQQLRYSELNRRANQLAWHLAQKGVQAGARIPLLMPRCPEMLVAQLAVLKSGCAYVPIDPEFPLERQEFMVTDCAARLVIGTDSRPTDFCPTTHWIALGDLTKQMVGHPTSNPDLRIDAQMPAYVMYTSGSTGTPKGVVVPHRAVNRLVINNGYAEITPTDCIAHCSNPAFDASAFEIWAALLVGARVLVVPQWRVLEPTLFAASLNQNSVTVLFLPTALFNQYGVATDNLFVSLKYLLFGGEACDAKFVRRVLQDARPRHLLHVYGPTETTTFSTSYTVECVPEDVQSIPIGRPISNTQIYILDERRQPAPIGVVGEIYIGGAGVARGYLNRPELTAERFVDDPFSDDRTARLYRSGDLGRWRADGSIEYVGRNDHQVKLRGYRIELAEIESRLSRHAQVKEAVVLVREDVSGEKQLVAYLTNRDIAPSIEELRTYLKQSLPEYMMPAAFVLLESLPLTATGKLDRKALPAPIDSAYALKAYEAPQGEIEGLLAGIWCELLHVERVGRHDNFFELGGHSLLIVQMIELLRQRGLGTEIRSIFESATLMGLANTLSKAQWAQYNVPPNLIPAQCSQITASMLPLIDLDPAQIESIVGTVPGGASNVQDIYPLTPLQEGILFHHLLSDRSGDTYVLAMLLALPSRLQLEKLIEALRAVTDRHDILRTAVLWEGLPRPVQVVYRQARLPVEELELDPTGAVLKQMKARMAPQLQRMDLRTAPLMRLQVARGEDSQWYALLQMHHMMIDHVAQEILVEEVTAHLLGRTGSLSPPPAFRGFVAQALKQAQDGDSEAFFRRKLGDVVESTAPFGLMDVHGDGSRIEEAREIVEARLCERVRRIARELGMSAAPLFHAAWALVVARTSGRDDVVFGSVLSGRLQGTAGADRVLGMFINTLPLRLQMRRATVRGLVQQTQRELVELLKYEQASLVQAQRCSGIDGTVPLFTAVLNYRHGVAARKELSREGHTEVQVLAAQERTNYPLILSVDDLGEQFNLVVQVDRHIDAHRVLGYVHTALEGLVKALESTPDRMFLDLPMLPEAERQQVIEVFNATQRTYPQEALIHELFESQVDKTPDAVAVIYEGRQLSYAELNRRANQLAHRLRAYGIGPDQLVGLCVERSLELVVGILGVLKAGGAYVPLDPSYPAERLEYLLKDASPRVVLTQARLKLVLGVSAVPILTLDEQWDEIAQQSSGNLDLRAEGMNAHHLAYVIYTSGSTGEPKGVMVEHRNVVRLFLATQGQFGFNERDVWTLFHSFAFDFSVWELWGALLYGGRVVVVPYSTARSAESFYRLLCDEGVTVLNQTPSAFRQLVSAQAEQQEEGRHALRWVIFGGEKLDLHTLQPWIERNGAEQPQLVNMYGITETTVHVTHRTLSRQEIEAERSSVIGGALSDLKIYLLDAHREPVPIGVVGEIYVGGAGVARGYLNQPQLTEQRFITDPFSAEPDAHMYRSGDLGRWRADGTIEYVGRNDHQVKLRGYRIELGEIESQLSRHPQVKEAVVLVREDVPGEKRLVAYVMSRDLTQSTDGLRTHLKGVLPEYMMPAAFVLMESLPLTANGKLDRRALPAPADSAYALKQYEAPQGEIEALLAGIWCELLQVERVGRQDNFFELGGHSLLIVQMNERLRQRGLGVEIRNIFESATLAGLAATLSKGQWAQHSIPPNLIPAQCNQITPSMLPLIELDQAQIEWIVSIVPGGAPNVQDIYPLTPLQEGILFHHLFNDRSGDTYILPTLLALPSRAQLERLIEALQAVVDRHDILRTAVLWEGLPRPVQVVYRRARLPVDELELDPGRDVLEQMQARMAPQLQRMELQSAPLLRFQVARGENSQWYALLQMHHLTTDHMAEEILVEELSAHLRGRAEPSSPPIAFREFVVQTMKQAQDSDAEAFFSRKLGDVEESTTPFGLVDVHGDGSQNEEVRQLVEVSLCERVRRVARELSMSPAPLFHVVWGLVVARTSGRDDVVFGSVLSGRLQGTAGADRMLGMFINTLPLRLRMKRVTVKGLVQQTQRELVELLQYEQASLAQAQRCSGIAGAAPLFSAMLNYRHIASVRTEMADSDDPAAGISVLASLPRTNYPIALFVDDLGEQFGLVVQVDRRIDAHRVLGYVHTALEALIEALECTPERAVLDLPILPEAERYQVIETFNATRAAYPQDALIHELFEAQVEKTPDAVAVIYEGQQLSYTELNRRANQLARYLRAQGIGPDRLVGVCVDRSLELVVGILGVLKAGGAYVPLDPSYPAERLKYLLKDASPRVVLTQARLKSVLAGSAVPILTLDEQRGEVEQQSSANLELKAGGLSSHHLAYVIYTSGSTGEPKGVMVEHRNLVNYASHAVRQFDVGSGDGSLICTSLAFDLALTGFYPPLLCGRAVRLSAEQQDLSMLSQMIEGSENLAPLKLTPSHLGLLERSLSSGQLKGRVRVLVLGGEVLKAEVVRAWREHAPQTRIFNHYGPTETTVGCVILEIEDELSGVIPIGRPISNTQIYILDERHQPVPIGVVGEIYIGGAGVARGYLNRPQLTDERFITDPFSAEPNARMYRSGDLGRWRADGIIEYVGRNDHQVKLRGYRIELGEIESQLSRHAQVKEAAVLVREDVPGEKRLVAYVTSREVQPSIEELQTHLKGVLPEYMMPVAYVQLECLPLTANGKLDRRALPMPEGGAYARKEYEAPQGEIEELLAGIWCELLHVERAGRHDNFFELGGHSLLAVQLLVRIRQSLGRELALREVFEYVSLQALARQLSAAVVVSQSRIERARRGQPLPLSLSQQRLWFIDQLEGAGAAYHISGAVRLLGVLAEDALRASLNELVSRHEVLRTSFENIDGEPTQAISEHGGFALRDIDLSALPKTEREQRVTALARAESAARFDLSRGPLIRGALLKLSEQEHVLLVTMHHIVSDGWSMGILTRELSVLYSAYREGRPNPLPSLPIQYVDYAQWQRHWLVGDVLLEQLEYWRAHLHGAPSLLELPTDRARPAVQSYRGDSVPIILGPELTQQLKQLSRRFDATLYMTLYAGFAILLSRVSGEKDIVIGASVANRQRAEVEELIGFFVNNLALRVQVEDQLSVAELLKRTRELTLAGYAHQEVPFEQVIEVLRPPRSLSHNPLFQVLLVLQNAPESELQLAELRLTSQDSGNRATHFDLGLSLQERGTELVGALNYASDLFDRSTIERWIGHFERVLEQMARDVDQRVGALNLLPEAERFQVIEAFNATQRAYPQEALIHELFETQVEKTPDAVAVIYEGQQLSYTELNRRANQLARYLKARGIGPDQLVGVCVERSLELVVGILGVLKSGGAYVPLDPSYPAERLEYLLKDALPRVVLTQARLKPVLAGSAVPILALDEQWGEVKQQTSANLALKAEGLSSHHLAYVIYTSGSSGEPKGVMVGHRNLVNYASHVVRQFDVGSGDGSLICTSLAFDLALTGFYPPLLCGRAVRLSAEQQDLSMLSQMIEGIENIAPLKLTPSHLGLLERSLSSGKLKGRVRVLVLGGEALRAEVVRAWHEHAPQTRIFNHYGPTETTVGCVVHEIEDELTGVIPIGRPISNTQIYILDEQRQPVPIGVVGEIYIGGAGVARGYLNRPQLTDERFIADPFCAEPNARMYRSGDLGRWRADGIIEYVGRNDHQVKLRGYRIELGEIESQLSHHAQVKEAVVLLREDVPGEKRLVAYVTSREVQPSIEELQTHLKGVLPEYMMPVAYVQLECLPLTANGKLDRRALPVPEGEAYARKEYEAPQGEIEELLAGIWCELLHVERVGRHDNFFELGGHSLLVVQLLVRIRRELNVDISIGLIFSKPTVAAIAVEVFLEKLHQFESSDVERLLSKDAHLSSVEHNRLLHKE